MNTFTNQRANKLSQTYHRVLLSILVLIVGFWGSVMGQDIGSQTAEAKDPNAKGQQKTKLGVFANFHSGITFGGFGKLQDDLKKPQLLKEDFKLNRLGSALGGDLFVQIGNRFLVGLGGVAYNYDWAIGVTKKTNPTGNKNMTDSSQVGSTTLSAAFITAKLGFVLLNKTKYEISEETNELEFRYRWMLFPYLGMGFGGTTMDVANYSINNLYFGSEKEGARIDRTATQTFAANLNVIDLGIGTRYMRNNKGGIMLGAEIGGYFNLGKGDWEQKGGSKVANVSQASLSGMYLRATVGGGFFRYADPNEVPAEGKDAYVKPEENKPTTDTLPTEEPKKEKKKKKKKDNTEAEPAKE
jgi:hypothetical protein